MTEAAAFVPARRLPILYFATAHLALVVATAIVAVAPGSVTGFYYHPWMIGVVHLVTLGWITSSILGALFVVGPLVLRMPLPVGRADHVALATYVIGVSGVVSHFWIEQYSGMAWSAAMVVAGAAHVVVRTWRALRAAPIPAAIRWHVALAGFNLLAAGVLGVLIGADREVDAIPGSTLANVYAHAHLAGLGWGVLMVVGVGYRLLPMVLPAAMPAGPRLVWSVVLIQLGVVGLATTLLVRGSASPVFALLAVTGLGVFLATGRWMLSHRRPAPPDRPRPDWALRHTGQALGYLVAAAACGLVLVLTPPAAWTARLAAAYGVCALIGGLAQLVLGLEHRLLPLFEWHTRVQATGFERRPPPPAHLGDQRLRRASFWAWTIGVPLLLGGQVVESVALVGAAGWCLLAASLTHLANTVRTLRSRPV